MGPKPGEGDMHYKMCKKIAQLTKVIYQLNTQNEDNGAWTDHLRQKHEEEVRTLCSDAERRAEEMREELRRTREQHNASVETALQQYKTELGEMRKTYAQKVDSITDEVLASKAEFERVIAEVKAQSQARAAEEAARISAASKAEAAKLCAAKEEEIANLRATKETEVANLVREYNDRYKSMLAEQMDARDSLEEQIRLLQSQCDDSAATHADVLQQWAEKLKKTEDEAARLAAELAQLGESNARLCAEKGQLQQECDALRSRLDAEMNAHGTSRDAEVTLREEMEGLKRHLREAQEERDGLERTLSEKAAALSRALSDVANLENQKHLLETQQSRHAHDVNVIEQKNRQLMDQVETLERCVKELREAAKLAEEKMEGHRKTELALEECCEGLRQQINDLVKKHQEELAGLRSSHETALATINSTSIQSDNALRSQMQEDKEKLESRHAETLRGLQAQHMQQMAQLAEEHEKALSHLRSQLENAGSVEESLRATLAQMQQRVAELDTELSAARNALQEAEEHQKNLAMKHEATMDTLAKQMADVEASKDARLRAEQEAQIEKIRKLETELDMLRVQFGNERLTSDRAWKKKLNDQTEAHEQLLQQLRQEHSKEIDRLNRLHEINMTQMQNAYEERVRSLTESAKRELEEERENFRLTQKDLTNQIRRCEEELRQARGQMDAMRHNAKEQATRLAEEVRALKDHVSNLTDDSERLQDELKTATAALQSAQDECARLRRVLQAAEGRERELMRAFEQLQESTNCSRLEVEALHKDYIASMERKHAQRLQVALDELRALLTKEHNAIQGRADETLAATWQKYAESQEEVKILKLKVDTLTQELRKNLEEMQREKLNMATARDEFTATVESMKRDFETERDAQKRFTENYINEVAAKHKSIVDDLMQQHNEKQATQSALIQELQAALDDLRHRYEYRESRAEDVAMINRLLKEGKQKDQLLKKAMSDLKMYKLELINREENYNKVFGRQPRVASGISADKTQPQR